MFGFFLFIYIYFFLKNVYCLGIFFKVVFKSLVGDHTLLSNYKMRLQL